MSKKGVKVWKYKNLDYFCSRFERSEFIETVGYRTAKVGSLVGKEISVFGTTKRFEKKFRKNFKKSLAETKIELPLQPLWKRSDVQVTR